MVPWFRPVGRPSAPPVIPCFLDCPALLMRKSIWSRRFLVFLVRTRMKRLLHRILLVFEPEYSSPSIRIMHAGNSESRCGGSFLLAPPKTRV